MKACPTYKCDMPFWKFPTISNRAPNACKHGRLKPPWKMSCGCGYVCTSSWRASHRALLHFGTWSKATRIEIGCALAMKSREYAPSVIRRVKNVCALGWCIVLYLSCLKWILEFPAHRNIREVCVLHGNEQCKVEVEFKKNKNFPSSCYQPQGTAIMQLKVLPFQNCTNIFLLHVGKIVTQKIWCCLYETIL